jgi:hypothetical protein
MNLFDPSKNCIERQAKLKSFKCLQKMQIIFEKENLDNEIDDSKKDENQTIQIKK